MKKKNIVLIHYVKLQSYHVKIGKTNILIKKLKHTEIFFSLMNTCIKNNRASTHF